MSKIRTFKLILLSMILMTFICFYNWTSTKIAVRDLIYLTRPVWDQGRPKPFNMIPHYYTSGLNSSQLCQLHNWQKRSKGVKIIDAVIFSTELDLLEIRFKELWPFVDYFVVLESDKTFTGRQKKLYLNDNLNRFLWAKDKLRYNSYNKLEVLKVGESPFKNEGLMRNRMNYILSKIAKNGDIIICSDVDEIPSAPAVQLLRECTGFPDLMHFQLKMYLFSFEFFYSDDDGWRAHIAMYNKDFSYSHGRVSDYMLADSGWHCSFCFRYISDFIFKMTSYSHNDRVMHQKLLDRKEIQKKICNGDDIYDMYPEAYTFKELVLKLGSIPKTKSMTNLPKHLIENSKKFAFLLPNGCVREDYNTSDH